MADNKQPQAGFALLVSLIVVTVVVSVGLALLDVTIKQLRLSSNSTDSEIAFHAANAGVECAQYVRRDRSEDIQGDEFADPVLPPGQAISGGLQCFRVDDSNYSNYSDTILVDDTDGDAFLYQYEFSWAPNAAGEFTRCSEIDMVVVAADIFDGAGEADGVVVTNAVMQSAIAGYPAGPDLDCPPGSACTVISSKGYNKNCDDKDSFGTVQREVLLEL